MKPLVIKVKFGETLRRFSIYADENGTMDFDDMFALKVKICGLFRISPFSDLTLTYIDEDNDFVSLIDDNDLHEAITQALNPLRIHVSSKCIWSSRRSKFRLSRMSSSPKGSPRINHPSSLIDSKVAEEFMKIIEQPMSESFSKLSHQSTKATSLALNKLVEGFLKWVDEAFKSIEEGSMSEEKFISNCPSGPNITEELGNSKEIIEPKALSCANVDDPVQENVKKQKESDCMSAATLVPPSSTSPLDSHSDHTKDAVASENSILNKLFAQHSFDQLPDGKEERAIKHNDAHCCGTSVEFRSSASPSNISTQDILLSFQTVDKPVRHAVKESCGMTGDGANISPDGTKQPSRSQVAFSFPNVSPNSDHEGVKSCSPQYNSVYPFNRNSCSSNDTGRIFHEGVRSSKSSQTYIPRCCNIDISQYPRKFDSRFIEDVTFPYGTTMFSNVPFRKIWKIRNIGTSAWPVGTRLVWAAGRRFPNEVATEIEIPVDGFPVGEELEIGVDLRTPKLHGSYMSFWIMQLPSGEKFGQGIPIFIKVDSSRNVASNTADHKGQSMCKNFNSALLSVLLPKPNVSKAAFPISDPEIECPDAQSKILLDGSRHRFTTGACDSNDFEQSLLAKLEKIGFKKMDLNKELLRLNNYNLQQTVNDLSGGVADWDLLEEVPKKVNYDPDLRLDVYISINFNNCNELWIDNIYCGSFICWLQGFSAKEIHDTSFMKNGESISKKTWI